MSPAAIRTSAEREHQRVDAVERAIPRDPRLRRLVIGGLIWLAAYAATVLLTAGHATAEALLSDGAYLVPIACATVLACAAARRRRGRARAFWTVLAISNAGWLAGEVIWSTYTFALAEDPPFPSLADAFYLASYALVPAAALVGFASMRGARAMRTLIDASIVVVAIGTSGYLLLIEPQLAWGPSLATAVGIAYPLLGVLILMVLAGIAFSGQARLPLSMKLVGAGFAASALTDVVYTRVVVLEESSIGPWLNLGWQLEALLLCVAAWIGWRYDEGATDTARRRARSTFPLVLGGVIATGAVVALDARGGMPSAASLALVTFAVVAVIASLHLTSREARATAQRLAEALREQERLAVTDGLTGLHNRRFFEEMVRLEADRAARSARPLGLLVIDLDHFKQVNDTHGHPAGDAVLVATAERFAAALRTSDVLARYGGEEFAILLPETNFDKVMEIAERCREALAVEPIRIPGGPLVSITASMGVAAMPDHAHGRDALIRSADSALYAAKKLGRNQVRAGSSDHAEALDAVVGSSSVVSYLQSLADDIDARQATDAHSLAMAQWAARLAQALGLSDDARWRAVAGARLHDVGKVAVPDSILRKPGSLDDGDWAIVHEHPERGARLVALDPALADVAPVVRDHHERVDGTGYPAGKAGEAISMEARIVAVCDAWAAMRAARAYRAPLSRDAARHELATGAGTQFDADVVATFLALESTGDVGALEAGAPQRAAA